MSTRVWLGWHCGWLHLDGRWVKCGFCDDVDEVKHVLRVKAKSLGLTHVHACVTRGGRPDWVPEDGEEMPVSLAAMIRIEGEEH
jgi:hypothetical protein